MDNIETGSRPKGGACLCGIPSIGAEKIKAFGEYEFSSDKYIPVEYFERLKRGVVCSGDILLYKDGAYTGRVSMALDGYPHEICAVNEHVFILRTKNNFAQFFLYFTLSDTNAYSKINGLACGKAAQPGLNQEELSSIMVPFPSIQSISDFERTVSPLMHRIAYNSKESHCLALLRDSILPRLMSGEIDVSDIDI